MSHAPGPPSAVAVVGVDGRTLTISSPYRCVGPPRAAQLASEVRLVAPALPRVATCVPGSTTFTLVLDREIGARPLVDVDGRPADLIDGTAEARFAALPPDVSLSPARFAFYGRVPVWEWQSPSGNVLVRQVRCSRPPVGGNMLVHGVPASLTVNDGSPGFRRADVLWREGDWCLHVATSDTPRAEWVSPDELLTLVGNVQVGADRVAWDDDGGGD